MGASEKDRYILIKRMGDRIITFTDLGMLSTWNLVTGKHVCTHFKEAVYNDIREYYTSSRYKNVCILYSISVVDSMKDE